MAHKKVMSRYRGNELNSPKRKAGLPAESYSSDGCSPCKQPHLKTSPAEERCIHCHTATKWRRTQGFGWCYNTQNKPDWLEDAAALAFIQRAAAGWGACGIDPQLELYKSLAHEFGHVLGLGHSATQSDAMSVSARTRAEWAPPSENDLERCRERYPAR
jgi:hypothetical protein